MNRLDLKDEHNLQDPSGYGRGNTRLRYGDFAWWRMMAVMIQILEFLCVMLKHALLLGAVAKVGVEGSNPFARSSFSS